MGTCPSCGASAPASASWCGQCYQPLSAPVGAGAAVPAGAGVPDRFGIVRSAVPPAPPMAPPAPPVGDPAVAPVPAQPTGAPVAAVPDQRFSWTDTVPSRTATFAPPPAPPTPVEASRTGSMGDWGRGSTTYLVVGAIALGALMQLVFYIMSRKQTIEPEAFVRYSIAATVTFYAGLAVILAQRIFSGGIKLFWSDGRPGIAVAIGVGIGGALGLLGVAVNSAASGGLDTDPGIELMTSEGDFPHIAAAVLIAMIAAPLVEEILFRGLFAESMRARGMGAAIWLSAIAFACWHLNPSALRYYALMGALLGLVYWKRGLLCSIAMHATFNGCLTVVAIMLALSPGQTVKAGDLTITAPRGWENVAEREGINQFGLGDAIALEGPSGAGVVAFLQPQLPGYKVNARDALQQLESGAVPLPGVGEIGRASELQLPAGEAVAIPVQFDGHAGKVVLLSTDTHLVEIVCFTAGSSQALQDFDEMLQNLRLG